MQRFIFSLFSLCAIHLASMAPLHAADAIGDSLQSELRSDEDRSRDADRKPGQVLSFFGLDEGMDVLDLFSGGGYYTEIVSRLVGPEGRVLAHTNEAYLAYVRNEVEARYDGGRLSNVETITSEVNDLELQPNSLDAVLAILTWHDFYYVDDASNWPKIDTPRLVAKLCSALRPGGVLGVIDHVAAAGSDPWDTGQDQHRIDPARIRSDLAGSCFDLEAELGILRHPADDYGKSVFDPEVRGKTDRVIYRFRRK